MKEGLKVVSVYVSNAKNWNKNLNFPSNEKKIASLIRNLEYG